MNFLLHVYFGSFHLGDVNDVNYDADGAWEGKYGWTQGLIEFHMRADMGSCEKAVMGLVAQAVSTRVTKHFVTILV